MAFVKKTWKDRIVQYANRRLLTKSGGEVEQVTVTRDEGTISEAGDRFDAATMNNLEKRVKDAFDDVDTALSGKAGTSDIPTKTSDLINDSNFATTSQVDAVGNGLKMCIVNVTPDGRYYRAKFSLPTTSSGDRIPILIIHGSQLTNSIYAPENITINGAGGIITPSTSHVTGSDYKLEIDNGSNAWCHAIIIYPSTRCTVQPGWD